MRSKIDWASLVVGSKLIVFALFYFVFEGNFASTSDWRGDSTQDFLRYPFGGLILERLIHGGACFRIFTKIYCFEKTTLFFFLRRENELQMLFSRNNGNVFQKVRNWIKALSAPGSVASMF